jgi:tetratricopeptide (TPR) repeat protein
MASASCPSKAACFTLEKGIYLARTGQLRSASEICTEVRASFRVESEPELYVWLTLLEGLIGFYSSATARDRVKLQRSFALAEAIGRTDLMQYAAAWLAHHHFNLGKYSEMAGWLRRSGLSCAINPSARIRSCMTVADAWQFVGNNEVASGWYAIARSSAVEIGDRASIMASIENRSAMRLDRIWLKSIETIIEVEEIEEIESELLGGLAYEKFTQSESLLYQALIWRSRLEVLKGNYADAMSTLSEASSGELAVQASLALMHDIDAAWIYFKMGRIDEAKAYFQLAKNSPAERLDTDDAAVYWKRMSLLDSELSDGLSSMEYSTKSSDALNFFYKELNDLEGAIAEFR